MVRSFFDPSMISQMMPKQGMSAAPVFDVKQLMETQRKNFQAVSDAVQLGIESMQQAMSRQTELVGRMMQDNSTIASSLLAEGTPEQKVQRQADLMRKSYESTLKGARELGDIIAKSGEEAAEIINRRISASLSEFKSAFERDGAAFAAATDRAAKETVKTVKVANKAAKSTARKARKAA
jgi:phasin family protein